MEDEANKINGQKFMATETAIACAPGASIQFSGSVFILRLAVSLLWHYARGGT